MLRNGNIIYGWSLNPDNLVEMFKVVLDLNVAHGRAYSRYEPQSNRETFSLPSLIPSGRIASSTPENDETEFSKKLTGPF